MSSYVTRCQCPSYVKLNLTGKEQVFLFSREGEADESDRIEMHHAVRTQEIEVDSGKY